MNERPDLRSAQTTLNVRDWVQLTSFAGCGQPAAFKRDRSLQQPRDHGLAQHLLGIDDRHVVHLVEVGFEIGFV
jgi:hypothetical protein